MKDFLLLYRVEGNGNQRGTPEQEEAIMQQWMAWLQDIAAKGGLIDKGHRLETTGKVVKPNDVVINGPYAEIKEALGGYSLIKAESYESAVDMAKACPILQIGGNVEVREISYM